MKISNEQETGAIDAYKVYFDSYIGGDIEAINLMLNEDYTQIGSAESEVFFSKEEALLFLNETIDQVAGKATIRNRSIKCEWLQDYIMVIDLFDMYVLAEEDWVFYSKFRASTLMEYKDDHWKFVHQHSSVPDVRTNEGDNIAIEKISAENLQLRDAIKRRTIELEQKNRELEIETSLEKIRSTALSMHEPDDMLNVCRIISQQLEMLGIEEIRNVQTVIINETQGKYINYQYFVPYNETATELIDYRLNATVQSFVNQMLTAADAFFSKTFEGQELGDWVKYRKDTNQLPDPKLESACSAHYYFYSIGIGALGVSTYKPLNEDSLNVFKRFRNVFDLAYRRYDDIKTAERQTKEAQIEVALERIRAKALAMQKSSDILEVADVMRDQMRSLGQPELESCLIHLYKEDLKEIESWYAYRPPEQAAGEIITGTSHVSVDACEWTQEVMDRYRSDESEYTIVSTGTKIQGWYKTLEKIAPDVVDYDERGQLIIPEILYYHFSKFSGGALLMIANTEASAETCEMLRRAAVVFELAYTRFIDLQKSEDQAREATIETALERVRSRTMAMQSSAELPVAANLLFQQMQNLGMPAWSAGYCIWNDTKQAVTLWMSSEGVIQQPFVLPLTEDPSLIHMRDAYSRGEVFHVEAVGGEELEIHYNYLRTHPVVGSVLDSIIEAGYPLPTFQIFHCVYFLQGFLLFITYEPVPQSWDVFKRFANVFNQTYTRFLDLQKAEAQARDAQIEVAVERVRAKALAMHNSLEITDVARIVRNELGRLNIEGLFAATIYLQQDDGTVRLWDITMHDNLIENGPKSNWDLKVRIEELHQDLFVKKIWNSTEKYFVIKQNKQDFPILIEWVAQFKKEDALEIERTIKENNIQHTWFAGVQLEHGRLSIELQVPPSDEVESILSKIGAAFDLAYRRFLDLKNAEALAIEAGKRASVDRVRAEIASMRTTDDLERITPLIWNELTTLGVPFIRCGVFIMNEEKQEVQTMLSTPDGNAIATIHVPFDFDLSIIAKSVAGWRKKEMYKEYWDKDGFTSAWSRLSSLRDTHLEASQTVPSFDHLNLHLLPFTQGMLYIGSETDLNENELLLAQNLADAFSTAYARYEDFNKLEVAKKQVDTTLGELQRTQTQLIQAEKMASLGQLTAGIAHEIQNPLNFVNNFSDLSNELLSELLEGVNHGNIDEVKQLAADIAANLEKISYHGKRADAIVKGMLENSRSSSGQKQPTDVNALVNEYLKLAFHGYRTKEKTFEVQLISDFDSGAGMINIAPQEIGRVLLNVFNNAFFAVAEKSKMLQGRNYEPSVYITTKKSADKLLITIGDNGPGIPENIIDKIFQPFFTTKPTGQGTGLGLSLAYDIITKGHDGQLSVNSRTEGVEFVINIPLS